MAGEVNVFVKALRDGKGGASAYADYCHARLVLPIMDDDYRRTGDPFKCPVQSAWNSMAAARGTDAYDEGLDDAAIADAFERGLEEDRERGMIFRTMQKSERPSPAEQIRALTLDEKIKLTELIGVKAVAIATAGGELS